MLTHYKFPVIERLNDVLPAIEGHDEFIVAVRDSYVIVNYNVSYGLETFPEINDENNLHAKIRRELRGIIFDKETGKIISRSFHKFFNIGERPETMPDKIDLSSQHVILDKLDGSFLRPVKTKDGIRWMTKMGVTDTAKMADDFLKKNPQYNEFANWACSNDLTAIFEFTSQLNRVVISYPKTDLTLLAIRHNITGEYIQY